jgi:nitroimidazol reductase NimA-like FMN-containing flavoprotein (pyridoxamine 5'-phosphate oxidase superfamily)
MTGVETDRNGLEILSRSESMTLLESATIGRVGVSIGALPVILPVNFAVVDGDIIVRTTAGTTLDAAAINLVVAFEVDGFDPVERRGWSVMVQGVAEEVTDPGELQRLRREQLVPWTGDEGHFVRIATQVLSGRRLEATGAGYVSG